RTQRISRLFRSAYPAKKLCAELLLRSANPPEPEPTDSAMTPPLQLLAKTFVQRQSVSSRARTEPTTTVCSLQDSSPNRGQPITLLQDLHPAEVVAAVCDADFGRRSTP